MDGSLKSGDETDGLAQDYLSSFPFFPNQFYSELPIPRAIEAASRLICTVLTSNSSLSQGQKEMLLRGVGTLLRNSTCSLCFKQAPMAASPQDRQLLKFSLKLARFGLLISSQDIESLRQAGFDEPAVLDAIITTAVGRMFCALADGLVPPPASALQLTDIVKAPESSDRVGPNGPYLKAEASLPNDFPPYKFFREQFGFVPNVYRAQALRPDILQVEANALGSILVPEDLLSRTQKENILLAVSTRNLNAYFVAVHSEILNTLGTSPEESDQIVADYRNSTLSDADKSLLDFACNLTNPEPKKISSQNLTEHGFTDPQIVEAIAMAALTNFLNTVQFGLGAVSDFPPRRIFSPKDLYPSAPETRPNFHAAPLEDPDAPLVARVQNGDTDAFELLVRKHTRKIIGILAGVVGNLDDAKDAAQDVFLKAYENISGFQGKSKFSTWLTSIAINTGTEILRRRKPQESLDDFENDEGFRPRQIRSWADDPEQMFAAAQMRSLVKESVLHLPEKYRVAVLLRDINQLSTEEAAIALGLSVPAMKARVLRGRLMLRESLAPHFAPEEAPPDA